MTAHAILQSASERTHRIKRKTRPTVLFWSLLRHFFWSELKPNTTHVMYAKQLTWSSTGSEKMLQIISVPKKGQAFNYGTALIGSVPKEVHSRIWTFLGTERIKLERVKYCLHLKFFRSRSSFYPNRSNFFGRVNGRYVSITERIKMKHLKHKKWSVKVLILIIARPGLSN